MSESTLSLKLSDLAMEVGSYLGFGRTSSNWSGWDSLNPYKPKDATITLGLGTQTIGANDTQLGHIIACINTGLEWFYHPPLLPGQAVPYRWTFLEPTFNLTTVAGVGTYDLPDEFNYFEDELVYDPSVNWPIKIKRTSEPYVRSALSQNAGISGKPTLCAVIDKKSDGALGQRQAVLFYPTPDNAYPLLGKYAILPQALTAANPYPLGGQSYGQCIKAACIAAAENDIQDEKGIRWEKFIELLQAAQGNDMRRLPDFYGYNGDYSDAQRVYPGVQHWGWPPVSTINGMPIPQ